MIKIPRVTLLFVYAIIFFNLLVIMEICDYDNLALGGQILERPWQLLTNFFVFEAFDSSCIIILGFRYIKKVYLFLLF